MVPPKKLKRLRNVDAVIKALDGSAKVSELTGAGATSVCNWRADEQFPARYYDIMMKALEQRGCTAKRSLWGQAGNYHLLTACEVAA